MAVPSQSGPFGAGDEPNRPGGGSPARRYDAAIQGVALARRRLEQGLKVLDRLVPIARRVSRTVGWYTAFVAIAAVMIVGVLAVWFWPSSFLDAVALLLLAALVLAPAVVLWLFHQALAEVVEIPGRMTAMPDVAREHGTELARLVRESRLGKGTRGSLTSLPRDLWRAGRLLLAAHDDLPGYGSALTLVSIPFLLATLVAASIGVMQIALAPFLVVGAVLTSLI